MKVCTTARPRISRREYRRRFEALLPRVERPVRYVGGEWNSVVKDHASVEVTVALAFPDTYEIGMSHLGYRILYGLLNDRKDVAAERSFAPWPDMGALLRAEGLPLASLESETPLAEFDLVGFSLQYELNFTNMLSMLDLAGIPLRSADRKDPDPLVIAGGSAVFNPEPVADFVDFFFVGDAEESLPEFIEEYKALRKSGACRADRVRALARLDGLYAPALYDTEPDPQTGLLIPRPRAGEDVPPRVKRRIVMDIDRFPFPEKIVVPHGEIVHDRVSWEIMRGCPVGCRFCQAGYIYRPTRERDPKAILEGVGRSLRATGYDSFSLTSLNTGEYGDIENVLSRLMDSYESESTSVSLSSLHASTMTEGLAEQVKRVRKAGFTIAPEAGSQRMRNVVNKNLTEEQILRATGLAFDAGWDHIKLYFMIGLPMEEAADIEAMVELAHEMLAQGRAASGGRARITLSASTFIPKPFTPFQWFPMDRVESFRAKQATIRRSVRRGVTFKHHDYETSFLEGVFSRGDRRLGDALEAAYRRGAIFDGWTEHLRMEAWREAFAACGIDAEEYATRAIPLDSELPWDVIDSLINRRWLRREYLRSREAATLSICGPDDCHGCAPFARDCVQGLVSETTGRTLDRGAVALPARPGARRVEEPARGAEGSAGDEAEREPPAPLYRYRVRFSKSGRMRFLGHLDLMRLLSRALLRAGVPLAYTRGFNPKPRLSFGPALAVGIASTAEHVDLETRSHLRTSPFLGAANRTLPQGIRLLAAVGLTLAEARVRIAHFRRSGHPIVRSERKGKIREIEVMPQLGDLREKDGRIHMTLRSVKGPALRPGEVLGAVFGGEAAAGMDLRREAMLVEQHGRLVAPLVAGRAAGSHAHRDHP
jgi:radical SAM family uncharacterized protein/radical SAM-linked protein